MTCTRDRLHARPNGPDARPAPAPKAKGGIPGWITWGIVVPLTLLCPPLFGPVLILCLVAGRD
jgi:hypothetical protein